MLCEEHRLISFSAERRTYTTTSAAERDTSENPFSNDEQRHETHTFELCSVARQPSVCFSSWFAAGRTFNSAEKRESLYHV